VGLSSWGVTALCRSGSLLARRFRFLRAIRCPMISLMAWPKRGTRKIVVDGEEFLWHYDACCLLCSNDVFTAGKAGKPFVLFIDPFPWSFEFRPKNIAAAIKWARTAGWSAERGATRALSFHEKNQRFEWLPEGQRHGDCLVEDNGAI